MELKPLCRGDRAKGKRTKEITSILTHNKLHTEPAQLWTATTNTISKTPKNTASRSNATSTPFLLTQATAFHGPILVDPMHNGRSSTLNLFPLSPYVG